jgi:hypothetical protein
MADIAKFQTMDKFLGVNTVEDPVRLSPAVVNREYVYPLQSAINVEIDNSYMLKSRSGMTSVLSGSDIHSLWADGANCFFVDGATLKRLNSDYTTVTLAAPLAPSQRVSYAPFNDRVYYTNGFQVGYVQGNSAAGIPDPLLQFKRPLPAGQLIEYYRGCLYVASGSILYISDPFCDYYDTRRGYYQFSSVITLLRAVDAGLYVGDTSVWWVHGESIEDFSRVESYTHSAIIHTDVRVPGQHVLEGIDGNVALWTSASGVCLGDNAGTIINLTEARYSLVQTDRGSAFIRDINNTRHYINSMY